MRTTYLKIYEEILKTMLDNAEQIALLDEVIDVKIINSTIRRMNKSMEAQKSLMKDIKTKKNELNLDDVLNTLV